MRNINCILQTPSIDIPTLDTTKHSLDLISHSLDIRMKLTLLCTLKCYTTSYYTTHIRRQPMPETPSK
jgi:hypothetical protein